MTPKTLRLVLSGAALAALVAAFPAVAQTATSTFQVTANVARNCTISASDIAITTAATPWDPTSAANPTATGTVTVRCTRGTSYTVDVGGGVYARQMTHTNGIDTLPYLFYAADCSSPFAAIGPVVAPNRSPQNHTICAGLDLASADPIAGDYSETVDATVQF